MRRCNVKKAKEKGKARQVQEEKNRKRNNRIMGKQSKCCEDNNVKLCKKGKK